ncbi:MAG: hypothetical protein ACTSUF_07630 [Candidatus Heimdallarchaeaceae archaeon]
MTASFNVKTIQQTMKEYFKNHKKAKKYHIRFQILMIFTINIICLAHSTFNFYFYFLEISALLVVYALVLSSFAIRCDFSQNLKHWNDYPTRIKYLTAKILYCGYSTLKLFIASTTVFFILREIIIWSQNSSSQSLKNLISFYQPSSIEILLVIFLYITLIVNIYALILWTTGRFLTLGSYDLKSDWLKSNTSYIVTLSIISAAYILLFWVIIDVTTVMVLSNRDSSSTVPNILKVPIETYPWLFVAVQLAVSILLTVIFLFDGYKQLKLRTNFVECL